MGIRGGQDQTHRRTRRGAVLATALVAGLLASVAVAAPARAAFQPPFQTNFEIDGNTVVNGSPPRNGDGAQHLRPRPLA